MPYSEESYDLLDVWRVLKSVWVFVVITPVLAAGALGIWSYSDLREESVPNQAQAMVRFPAKAFPVGLAERTLRSTPELVTMDRSSYNLWTDDIPGAFLPTYRTIRIGLDAGAGVDTAAVLQSALNQLAHGVSEFDADNQRKSEQIVTYRDTLSGYLSAFDESSLGAGGANVIAEAAAVASLVGAMQSLEAREQELALEGQGPLEIIEPARPVIPVVSSRWMRYPIVGGIGALIAVLFVVFTLDGLKTTAARRRRQQ